MTEERQPTRFTAPTQCVDCGVEPLRLQPITSKRCNRKLSHRNHNWRYISVVPASELDKALEELRKAEDKLADQRDRLIVIRGDRDKALAALKEIAASANPDWTFGLTIARRALRDLDGLREPA